MKKQSIFGRTNIYKPLCQFLHICFLPFFPEKLFKLLAAWLLLWINSLTSHWFIVDSLVQSRVAVLLYSTLIVASLELSFPSRNRCIYIEIAWHFTCTHVGSIQYIFWLCMTASCTKIKWSISKQQGWILMIIFYLQIIFQTILIPAFKLCSFQFYIVTLQKLQ